MKAIILCAGYATRLYPLTENQPKPLLPVKGKPIIDYLLEKIEAIPNISETIIVTNNKFYNHFCEWAGGREGVKVINDMTLSNDDRLEGIGDLCLAIEKENIDEDALVILGDNLFDDDLRELINKFEERQAHTIGLYNLEDLEAAKKFGIIDIDSEGRIKSFEEKPESPKSSLISTGIYLYTKDELKKILEYNKREDRIRGGPGYLIPYFLSFKEVYGFPIKGKWYDIGSKETYEEVNRE